MIGEKLLHDKKSCSPGSRQSKLASASTNTGTDRMEEPAPTGRPDNGNGKPSMGSRRRLTIPSPPQDVEVQRTPHPKARRTAGPSRVAVRTPRT